MSAPRWAVGMQRLSPGIYLDKAGAIHFSLNELCDFFHVLPTKENARIIEEQARKALAEEYGSEFPVRHVEG